jgi:hypothetical protein
MTARSLIAGLALALTAISCSDKGPTAPPNETAELAPARPGNTGPLVTTITNLGVTDALLGRGTFTGTLTITSFATNAAGDLLANGSISGVATFADGVTRTFTNVAFTGLQVRPGQRCQILFLDIGPIFLDLLGLQVDLSQIILDITAVAGPGNLLGNLLCALVGLLDQNPLAAGVQGLLDQINAILAG